MVTKPCSCPSCTAPLVENEDGAVLIHDEDDLSVHWLVNNGGTDRSTWDVASCGRSLDISSEHLKVRDEVRLEDLCVDCMVNFADFLKRERPDR